MATTRINNQAIKVYDDSETLFNDQTSTCNWHVDYFPLVTCDDTSEIMLNTTVIESDIERDGTFSDQVTGTSTTASTDELVDSGADFDGSVGSGGTIITTDMVVQNTDTGASANVVSVDSATTLTLSADIFTDILGEDYAISDYGLTGNMTIGTNELIKAAGGAGTMTQSAILEEGHFYKYSIDITSFSSTTPGDQINLIIGGETVLTIDETNIVVGTYTVYGFSTASAPTEIQLTADAGIAATFSDLTICELSNTAYFVMTCDDTEVKYTSITSDITGSNTNAQLKMSFDWSNLQDGYDCEGCFYIRSIDDVGNPINIDLDRISEGDFATSTNWTLGTGWSIVGNAASLNSASAGDLVQSTLANNFSKSISYDLVFTVSGHDSGGFDVKLYNGVTEVANLGSFNANGTYTVSTGVLTANCDTIKFEPTAGSQIYVLDDISATIDVLDSGYDWRTDCFQLKASHDCTMKLSGTNLDNAFGIDFVGLGYSPSVRITGELEFPKYEGDKENEEDSAGVSKTLYFKSEKRHKLFIWQQPEYMHDFLRLLVGYDTFLVDSVGYIAKDSSYGTTVERQAGKMPDLANASIQVRLKNDLNENKFC